MLWLIWEMWIVLALFFVGGVIAGWIVRGRSDETDAPAAKQLGFATRMDARAQPEPAAEPMPSPEPAPPAEAGAQPDPGRETAPVAGTGGSAGAGDDLTAIKGLGPKAAERLQEMGVTHYAQIAAWDDAEMARFDRELNARGRVVRDDWVGQARALSS